MRMNGTVLAHHTQLTDWCVHKRLQQQQQQQQQQQGPADLLHRTKQQSPLSPDKYESIGQWCTEVNRLFVQPPRKEPKQLFRKCKYSDSMFPPNKSTARGQSAGVSPSPSARLWSSSPGRRSGVRSAVLTGKAAVKPPAGGPQGGGGAGGGGGGGGAGGGGKAKGGRPATVAVVVADDEKNTALAAKMADSAEHYSQERRTVHLHIQPQWKRKLSTGWTINRPLLYPKVPPPPPPENLLVDIPDYLVRGEERRRAAGESSPGGSSTKGGKASTSGFVNLDIPDIADLSEQGGDKERDKDPDDADVKDKGTQWCEAASGGGEDESVGKAPGEEEEEKEKEAVAEAVSPRSRYKPIISDRSTSNDILNVLSVDDCRMMMRYRPARVVDTQDFMILPSSKSHVAQHHPDKEDDGDDATKDTATATSQNTPIRLSQGSARTTLSHTQVCVFCVFKFLVVVVLPLLKLESP